MSWLHPKPERQKFTIELADSDVAALEWAWRQDMARNPGTPMFTEWLRDLLWEQANAVRVGIGPHTAWAAANSFQQRRAQRARVTQQLYAIPNDLLGPRY